MNMKNMKTTSLVKGFSKLLLVAATLTLGCMSAFSQITNVRSISAWNGSCSDPVLIGDYYQFSLDGFNGEIVLETADFVNAGSKPSDSQFELWTLKDDTNPEKAVKIQVKSGYTGFLCVNYDPDDNSVNAAYGSCSGTIKVSSNAVCKGSPVTFSIENGDASASKSWGLLLDGATSLKDANWISDYENMDQFDYVVNDSLKMVLKYTTTSGLVSYSMMPVYLSIAACGDSIVSDKTEICPGEEVTFTSTYKNGSVYEWQRSNGAVVATTNSPTLTFHPNTTLYYLYVDGLYAGSVQIKLNGCGFFITPLYPITTCLQDSNYLFAVGDVMVDDIKNDEFEWQSSSDGENWTTIPGQNSYRLPVYPTEDTYYRAKYNKTDEYTASFLYELPNCEENRLCEGLQTRVLFYETFGFFVNENTYVSDKDAFVNEMTLYGSVGASLNGTTIGYAGNCSLGDNSEDYISRILNHERDGSGFYSAREDDGYKLFVSDQGTTSFHIQKFVAPDPNGYVVPASQFVRVVEDNGKVSTSNQFVGTDGHLFLQANPVLPLYSGWGEGKEMDNNAFRLQDGYYAIVANPDSVDRHTHRDYADIPDATGNVNGAMLMINSGRTDVSRSAIYAQRVVLGCAADRFAFSMNVRNAAKQDGKNPVNISVLLLEDIGEELPAEYKTMGSIESSHILNQDINSGDLPSGSNAEWVKVEKYVELGSSNKVKSLWVVLYNNGKTGDGNDMVIDDISFSVCLPKAELAAKVDGDLVVGSLNVCDGRDVELVATQKGNYIPDPVYLFQYFDNDKKQWLDMMDYSDESVYKQTNTVVSVTDPRFVGDVDYRVIIGSGVRELREVADAPDDVCNEFLVAKSNIDIRNNFGGPMCEDTVEEVCFVVGDTVTITGCRNLSRSDHKYKMFWTNEKGEILVDTLEVTGVSSDDIHFIIDKNYNVRVFDRDWKQVSTTDSIGMSKLYFVALDGNNESACEHRQFIELIAKHVVNLGYHGDAIGCDSVLIEIDKDVPEAGLVWNWGMDGREYIFNDTARSFVPDGMSQNGTIRGVLKIRVDNDGDKYCAPAEALEIDYHVNNASYNLSITASPNTVCVTPGQDEDVVLLSLTPNVDPAPAENNIYAYNWRLDFGDGDVIDTVSYNKKPILELTHRILKSRTGKTVKVELLSTETLECGVINNDDSGSAIEVDIREGQFYLTLDADNPKVCLNSTDTIYLTAKVNPASALTNIKYLKLIDDDANDSISFVTTNTVDSVYSFVVDKDHFSSYFVPGTTKNFKIATYDAYCRANSISPFVEVDLNGYTFEISDDGDDNKECLELGQKLELKATLSDPNAANLIKSYEWYRDGEFVGGSGLTYQFTVNESSNSNYKLVLKDGICSDVADSLDVAVSINYHTSLYTEDNKLTTCQNGDSAVVHVTYTPAASSLLVKQYEWHAVVNGKDTVMSTGSHADSILVITAEKFPWLVRAGVNASIYLITRDSICPEVVSDGSLDFRFNAPYEMTIDYNGSSICVPSESDIDPDTILLRVGVNILPAEALTQVGNYVWHVKSKSETLWNVFTSSVNHMEFTYNDLKQYKGEDIEVYVSSYDNICAMGNDPNMSDTLTINIRVGGFDINLRDIPSYYCIESLDDAQFVLKAVIDPAEAINNISEFYWYDGGKLFATTKADSIVLDKESYPTAFNPGYTANFSVGAYDSHCERDTVRSEKSTEVEFNTHFSLSLSIPSHKICLPASGEDVLLTAHTDPSNAINHIKRYVWQRISPSALTTETSYNVLNLDSAGWLAVSEKMEFTVTVYDDVCYNVENGGADKKDSFMVNSNFTPKFNLDDNYMCSEDDDINFEVVIDPSDAFYYSKKYHYIYQGKTYDIDDSITNHFYAKQFPHEFRAGDVIDMYVVVDDDNVCGPIESERNSVYIQTPYKLTLDVNKNDICVNDNLKLNISSVDPSGSERFIKKYIWYDGSDSIPGFSDKKNSSTSFSLGGHNISVVSVDSICPNVTSNVQKVVVYDSLRVSLTPSTYTYCESFDGDIKLTATVTTGTPNRFELYDANTKDLIKTVNASTKTCTFEGYNPSVDHNSYFVRVYDDVCSSVVGSEGYASVSINVHVPVEFKIDIKDDVKDVCVGDTINLSLIPISGFPSYYTIYGKTSESVQRIVAHDTTKFFDIAKEGGYLNYTIVAIDEICPNSSESQGSVFVHETPQIKLYANKENVIIGGDILLYADPEMGSPTTYEWFCDGQSFDVTSTNSTTYLPASTSEYTVVASDGVCPSASSSIKLEVKLPTAFTPFVVDDLNDTFMRGFNVMIFDRYGQKIYEGEDGWTGQKGNSSALVDPGVYYYKVVMKNGKVEKGTVEVVLNK